MVKRGLIIFILLASTAATVYLYTSHDSSRLETEANMIEFSPVEPGAMGVDQRLDDFQHFHRFIEANYPYIELKERTHGVKWLDLREGFEARIRDAAYNEEFLQVIMEAVTALQNRHTQVVSPEEVIEYRARFSESYPMNAVFCDEVAEAAEYWTGIYDRVTQRKHYTAYDVRIVYDRGNYILADYYGKPTMGEGSRITKVNGERIDDAVKTCFSRDYLDWDFTREKLYLWRIAPHDFGGDAVFTVVDHMGHETDVTFGLTTYYNSLENLYPRGVVRFEKYDDARAGYIYVRTFDSILESRYEDILGFLREIEDYEYLIIDIRGNTGGYFRSWVDGIVRPLLKEDTLHEYYLAYRTGEYVQMFHEGFLSDKVEVPKDEFSYLPPEVIGGDFKIFNFSEVYTATHEAGFSGKVILLTDHVVYSAAEGFTNFCKQTGFATVYGTASGGDGFFMWPLYYVLPNSKLVITVTSAMSLDASGHSNEEMRTRPDVYHESPFMDMGELINYVLEEIK